jgi:hypothetical protein
MFMFFGSLVLDQMHALRDTSVRACEPGELAKNAHPFSEFSYFTTIESEVDTCTCRAAGMSSVEESNLAA